jgi:hypothetical protein
VKTGRHFQRAFQPCPEVFPRHFDKPELAEMRVVKLRIQQHETAIYQSRHKVHQRNL